MGYFDNDNDNEYEHGHEYEYGTRIGVGGRFNMMTGYQQL
jgi:hypothetical protein